MKVSVNVRALDRQKLLARAEAIVGAAAERANVRRDTTDSRNGAADDERELGSATGDGGRAGER